MSKSTTLLSFNKLVRTTKLEHPLNISFETPLLVPSFSSKGFGFKNKDESEVSDALEVSKEFLGESVLFSAYDFYHNHIPHGEEYLVTDITFIDSGGYETSEIYDFSTTAKYSYPTKEWDLNKYEKVISEWPQHKAGIIVSYDHGKERYSLDIQINNARKFFSKHENFLSDFLIKPETDKQKYVQIENIVAKVGDLQGFSIIGVTEKELGNSILARMVNIAKIRIALDNSCNKAPIHVFGSLDPITSLLYFLAGAEIFDGLTWLKFSYFKGSAIYQSNYGALHNELGIHSRDDQVRSKSVVNNLYCLEKMKYLMRDFNASEHDFSLFNKLNKNLGDYLKESYITFQSNLK